MCDDFTAIEEAEALRKRGLNRRQFSAISVAATLAACSAGPGRAQPKADLREAMVTVKTTDGEADAFFVHPVTGTHPAVLMWPDIAGLRDAYKQMARRLAGAGYAVLVVNHYYRSARAPIVATMAEWRTPEGQAKLKPMIAALTPTGIASDAQAFVGWLDAQDAVDTARGVGSNGYCMTGGYAIRAAAAMPGRVRQACSFHGAGLVSDLPDSPHLLIPKTKAGFLFAIARNDDARDPAAKDALRATAEKAQRSAEIEVYPADHGWCTLDAPAYDKDQAERAWTRLLAHYAKL
jgi:carboxymethylenebutenolidase